MSQVLSKHWMLGYQSEIASRAYDNLLSYNFGPEPLTKVYLESEIFEKYLVKSMIPRYYKALTRAEPIRIYDPLITIGSDSVSFLMIDKLEEGFWELSFNHNVFSKDTDFNKGECFVDFNIEFINKIRNSKDEHIDFLVVDETGLEYASNEDSIFLPKEDRPTLVRRLNRERRYYNSEKYEESVQIPTIEAYSQATLHNKMVDENFNHKFDSLFDWYPSTPSGLVELNDWYQSRVRGEIFNPFAVLKAGKFINQSVVAQQFGNFINVKYFKSNHYLVEIPLVSSQEQLGFFKFFSSGRNERTFGLYD